MNQNNPKFVSLGTALIVTAMVATVLVSGFSASVFAQGTSVDTEKLKQILNATRTALEANDLPGALTQLDLAEQQLSGSGNITTGSNMTNTTTTVVG
jgi:hypothetical protein